MWPRRPGQRDADVVLSVSDPGPRPSAWHDDQVMSFPKRRISDHADDKFSTGRNGTVRTHRDLSTLLGRVQEGDLVVLDRRDLDAATAKALLDRRPWAVLNAAEFISGRFANLGPKVLADGGVLLLEADPDQVRSLTDGTVLRLDQDTLYDGAIIAADVRRLSGDEISRRMEQARSGLASQLDSFAHTASEFLRREEPLLLHGTGAPDLRTKLRGRTVVVVGPLTTRADLKRLRTFTREQKPVVIGVDAGGDLAARTYRRVAVLILSGAGAAEDRTLARTREVVLSGTGDAVRRRLEQRNLPVHEIHTSVPGADIGLVLAHLGGARLIVPTGSPGTIEEFIDRGRNDQASNVLTRLRLGGSVVEAAAVPELYTGRVRRWQLGALGLVAVGVLAFSAVSTPVGQDHWRQLGHHLPASWGIGR